MDRSIFEKLVHTFSQIWSTHFYKIDYFPKFIYYVFIYFFNLNFFIISGFEISDVLGINDKDYSITFGLYFSAEWLEPRLNLSTELWGEENVASENDLVPGDITKTYLKLHNLFILFSGHKSPFNL